MDYAILNAVDRQCTQWTMSFTWVVKGLASMYMPHHQQGCHVITATVVTLRDIAFGTDDI